MVCKEHIITNWLISLTFPILILVMVGEEESSLKGPSSKRLHLLPYIFFQQHVPPFQFSISMNKTICL